MAAPTRLNPPFRADHVGSFLRPKRLLDARERAGLRSQGADDARGGGEISLAELRRVEDDCIREVIKLQEDVGLRSITDGEFRRASWAYDLTARIEGVVMKREGGPFEGAFTGGGSRPPVAYTEGKIRRKPEGLVVDDFKFVKPLTRKTAKITIPSPTLMYVRGGRASVSETAYPDIEQFFHDLTQVYREEIAALAAAGCTYVQIDNTDVAYINDPKFQAMARRYGMEPREQAKLQGRLISMATRGRPKSMTVSMHMCRGNSAGNWMAEGGYDFVAETLFNEFDVDAFFMEYDSPRAGDFKPLRFAPRDKVIVLGLVTTKTPENDSKETLKRRIDEAAKYVPLENLALSPQCGFASVARGNPITADDQRRKLELVVEVAREVWGSA
jgi:5-methyltetrahydropteroyltriglutamate--homocysteine methyltransferase